MDSSSKDGSSYIDGIPFRISPRCYPPRPVSLPLTLDTNTADLLNEEYDFSMERRVIDHINQRQAELSTPKPKKEPPPPTATESQLPTERVLEPLQPAVVAPLASGTSMMQLPPLMPRGGAMAFNLSDFENDTSSPFDYMELQTINDLEELSSVFQGIKASEEPEACTVAKSISFPLPPQSSSAPMPTSLSEAKLCNYGGELPQVPYVPTPLRGCKSYSDIPNLSEEAEGVLTVERSKTPPTIPMTQVQPLESPSKKIISPSDPHENHRIYNEETSAYEELDDEGRCFVDKITEMGFVKGQVARAVKHLGIDDKKVIEHLCQIQMLEESGYESSEAEAALHLHDYNREQAKAFLDLVIRFQDLGFEKDAVKKALVQNKNDWNKTIDALLT